MESYSPYLDKVQAVLFLFICVLFVGTASPKLVSGQSFDEGIQLYQDGEYAKAAALFDKIHTNRGLLFAGKAYWNSQDFNTARSRLLKVADVTPPQLAYEATYTLSLIDIRQKKYGDALPKLFRLTQQQDMPQIATQSQELYEGLLLYLTYNQRLEIMQTSVPDTILFDLTANAMGRVDYNSAQILVTKMKNMVDDIPSSQIDELTSLIENEPEYLQLQEKTKLEAFEGLTHNIGIALPAFSPDKREYSVSRGLYLGFMLAAEQFNEQHKMKVNFVYENTGAEADSAQKALESLKNAGVDAILGPLFSERAQTMAEVSKQYQTPIIAPLANSASLTEDEGYFYQVNPSFDVHGQNMADYAYESLNVDSVAIIAQKGSLGAISAKAFQEQFKKKGGGIPHFFVEELGQRGEGLSRYSRFLAGDPETNSISAVYAPFTEEETAPALIDHLLRQLNTLESNITILGSPEWANRSFSSDKIGQRPVYFTESFYTQPNNTQIDRFKIDFRNRFRTEANRFAMIGYDTAMFLLNTIERVVNPGLLQQELVNQPPYNGLITNIDFKGSNVNQKLMIFKLTDRDSYLVRE
ncbi:ABC transporter substrate-binding protein [Fodinibius salsisoli]|uniref:ABC transporter substrate-binding protein n=1 Tax=Fodinibius salsisoli TaxID=2820877 RepID=A0ABT3PK83_9BACT|nr:ABC transporter substrate-binding protein [Fodinibius salsisoli]MCW9706355.1 ABC transporter substrate-binding protein [Fodinibius salsisoli]